MPVVKVRRIERLSKGCVNVISNGLKSLTTMGVGYRRRTRAHLEDLLALLHP